MHLYYLWERRFVLSMQTSKRSFILHRTQYYETDAMKIVHHANYVKWMEEARLRYFDECGFHWKTVEETTGIMIPVLFQSVQYKQMVHFDEEIRIECECTKFNGVKMNFQYTFQSCETEELKAVGITKHGFLDRNYHPVALQEYYPQGFKALNERWEYHRNEVDI